MSQAPIRLVDAGWDQELSEAIHKDPRRAYMQQPAVELSSQGLSWLGERLQAAFDKHGKVPQEALDELGWPTL